jgi:hypothetical protein
MTVNILQAVADRKLFGAHFRGETWSAWIAFLAALFALPLTPEQLALYQKHTGRTAPPTQAHLEAWLVCGRRAGKSFMLALVAVFLATFKDWRSYLGPGEVGTIMIVATDRKQARTIMRFALGLLKASAMLRRQIEGVTRESIALKNDIIIEVHTASFRTVRGYTVCAALLDELAFWPTDELASEPDTEVLAAVRPAMATVPGAMLLCASSPYARRGTLWHAYKKHFGKDGDPILVWQAPTRAMNPSVPQAFIDQHLADDPARAAAEYLAEFRTDIEAFVSRESVMQCVDVGVFERPKQHYKTYQAFTDPSGGSSDSFALAIGHKDLESKQLIVDAIRERRAPFNPTEVVQEFSQLCKSYGVSKVTGDHYAGSWPAEAFGKCGIRYEASAKPKSALYGDLLAGLNGRRIMLLDHARLVSQLIGLECRTARSGKDSIDHVPGGMDDVANCVAGLFGTAISKYPNYDFGYHGWSDDADKNPQPAEHQIKTVNEICYNMGNWWQTRPQEPYHSEADENLKRMYRALAGPPWVK